MINQFLQLGFKEEEACVYLTLLESGESTAGPIIKKTGFHRQVVYDTLESLLRDDYISMTVKSNRKHWLAEEPTILEQKLHQKQDTLSNLLPQLLSLQSNTKHRQEVRIFEGPEGLATVQLNNVARIPERGTYYVIGSSPKHFITNMQKAGALEEFEEKRLEKQMKIRLIFSENERKTAQWAVQKHFSQQPKSLQRQYRFLPEKYDSPVGIHIWEERIALIIYLPSILIIDIKNDLLTKDFLQYFNILWKRAKK